MINTGYRLLRSTIEVDPKSAPWLKLDEAFRKPFTTVESTKVSIEVSLAENQRLPLRGHLDVVSNGGKKRIEVVVEKAEKLGLEPVPSASDEPLEAGWLENFAGLPVTTRIAWLAGGLGVLRFVLAAGSMLGQGLTCPVIVFAIVGGLLGVLHTIARKSPLDALYGGFAGACLGVMLAAVTSAAAQTVEPLLGSFGELTAVAVLLWALLGGLLAWASVQILPTTAKQPVEAAL